MTSGAPVSHCTSRSACSSSPWSASHRGLSGIRIRSRATTIAGMTPDSSMSRHVDSSGRHMRRAKPMVAPSTMPTAWKENAPVIQRPRSLGGITSATKEALSGYSAPTAIPCRKRKLARDQTSHATADRTAVTTNNARSIFSIRCRPMRSASCPENSAPGTAPSTAAPTATDFCHGSSPRSATMSGPATLMMNRS